MDKIVAWFLVSSVDPDKFSLTVKGVMVQYIGIFLLSLQMFGVPVTESEVMVWITQISLIMGTVMATIGLLRKGYHEMKELWKELSGKF